jgi:hypothetical protein
MAIYGQPVISRETRLLLITIVVAIASLWVLARIRFQDRATASSATVPPVLAQLRPSAGFADLALTIAEIRPVVLAAVFAGPGPTPALRIREDAAATLTPAASDVRLASDRATGLTIVQIPTAGRPGLMPWVPRLLDYPRYLVAADLADGNVALRPVFVGGLYPAASPLWNGEVWVVPRTSQISEGTLLFTTDGVFAGVGIDHRGQPAIVPPAIVLSLADRVLRDGRDDPGEIAITVQSLSPEISAATGAMRGVVIAGVNASSPATDALIPTDVIEAVDGHEITSPEDWRARVARLRAGDTVALRVRRGGEARDVKITAVVPPAPVEAVESSSLGIDSRAVANVGAEVLSVQTGSRAAHAGIIAGDVITVFGAQETPTPAGIQRAYTTTPQGGFIMAAITRGEERRVVAIQKR